MSRYNSRGGVYVPLIESSPEVEDIAEIIALSAARTLRTLSEKVPFVDIYLEEVSRNGYENRLFDDLVQLLADIVDSNGSYHDDRLIEDDANQVVLGQAALYILGDRTKERLLTPEELDVAHDCAAAFDIVLDQLRRPARRGRGRGRDRGRDIEREDYNGGRRRDTRQGRYDDDRRGGYDDDRRGGSRSRRSQTRERGTYRGSESNTSRGRNAGRQPPVESYHDIHSDYDRGGSRLSIKEQMRQQDSNNTPRRRAETVNENRRGNDVPVGRSAPADEQRTTRRQVREEREAKSDAVVNDNVNQTVSEETWFEKEDGSRVKIINATERNMKGRNSPYTVVPVFPMTVDGYFTLKSNGDITGVIGLPKKEEDMDRQRHDVSKFFKSWGSKTRLANHKATSKALGDLQNQAVISQLEKELADKYDFEKLEEYPNIDSNLLYVVKDITTYELHEDFVSTGKQMLLDEIGEEHVKEMFGESVDNIPINYSAVSFYGWSLTGDAATKAMELKGLRSFTAIKNKLYELESVVSDSILHELDLLATNWVNEYIQYTLGVEQWNIDSFMLDIDDLITELATTLGITTAFTNAASKMVESVLCPLNNKDPDIRELTGLSEDGPFTVKFGKLSNITLLQIDSDELAIFLEGCSGSVTHDSWSSLAMAINIINTLAKPNTAETILVTRDNRKVYVTEGKNIGEYIISR